MEKLMKLTPDGKETGEAIDRSVAHEKGIWHGTSQVFVYKIENEIIKILLQKRCAEKDSYPNCWDISCAGHVPFGMDYLENAVKELEEELGLSVNKTDLQEIFLHKFEKKAVFYGKPFTDRQFSMVYILNWNGNAEDIVFQKEEISEVKWFAFDEIFEMIEKGNPPNCLNREKCEKVLNHISFNLKSL